MTVSPTARLRGHRRSALRRQAAPDESFVILLHPPLPLLGVSMLMERERQQNESLVNGYRQAVRRPAGCLPDPVQGAVGQQCALQWP